MRVEPVHEVDFETKRIQRRPEYPPKPVGVAIRAIGQRKGRYYAFGHPEGNNCTEAEAKQALTSLYKSGKPMVFHNGKFDLDVAETHWGLTLPPWHKVHDTMLLAFLRDPHANKLDLKTFSEIYLGEPPEERDRLHEWILSHVFTSFPKGAGSVVVANKKPEGFFKIPPTKAGGFICHAPGGLAGEYAVGDIKRTGELYRALYPYIVEHGMKDAYDRERRLLPVLLHSERQGVSVQHKKLAQGVKDWENSLIEVDRWINRRLKTKDVDVDKSDQLADAIEDRGLVDEWILTPGGKRSVSKDNLIECITDHQLVTVLGYRAILVNSLRNFGRPWLRMANESEGFIYTNWNQVRATSSNGKGSGARTGRLSSSPNFQNVANKPKEIKLPAALARKVVPLPYMRGFISPRKNHVLLNRDYSQQELRILGHYEDGVLLEAYQTNPLLDLHDHAKDRINERLGMSLTRKPIKGLGFGLIYGMGIAKTANEMGVDVNTAKLIKRAYLSIFPGLQTLIDELIETGKAGEAIRTWGGREYYVEPPKYDKKRRRWMTYEYKLLNVLIQGSAADCTKEAAIRVYESCKNSIFLMSVHDELMLDTDKKAYKSEMGKMKEAMESIEFDVSMKSDGKYSFSSWGEMKEYKD